MTKVSSIYKKAHELKERYYQNLPSKESLLELTDQGDRETIVRLRHLQQNIVLFEKIERAIQNLS